MGAESRLLVDVEGHIGAGNRILWGWEAGEIRDRNTKACDTGSDLAPVDARVRLNAGVGITCRIKPVFVIPPGILEGEGVCAVFAIQKNRPAPVLEIWITVLCYFILILQRGILYGQALAHIDEVLRGEHTRQANERTRSIIRYGLR